MLTLTASRVNAYRTCSWMYHLKYNEKLIPKTLSKALKVGGFVHMLMEKHHRGMLNDALPDPETFVKEMYPNSTEDALDVAMDALTLFSGYLRKYRDDKVKVESSETHLEMNLGDFNIYSRVDSLKRSEDGRLWRGEYKTAGRMDSLYLKGLKGGVQSGIAHLLLKETVPERVSGTIYDILVKTKVPQYERSFILQEKSIEKMTLECLQGTYRDIAAERFYRNMNCIQYNRECEYALICQRDTQQNREAFYMEYTDPLGSDKNESEEE